MSLTSESKEDAEFIESVHVSPHVRLIRIARPEKRNAMTNGMVIEIGRLLRVYKDDVNVRCVVITGDEKAFSAGADLKNMHKFGSAAVVNDVRRAAAWEEIERFPKPFIAAANGYTYGAGNELAMCCDFVIAGSNALFGQPEAKTSGMAGDGGTQRLPRKLGPSMAAYMIMTGEPISAQAAKEFGYVIEICEPQRTVERALEIAEVISMRGPLAVQAMKACMRVAAGATHENGLAYERMMVVRNQSTPDRAEGLAAFSEKREPKFTGLR
ncbi:2,3-dehydroadipyl-CoA hydratase [Paraburkholderia sp. Ac-20336]|uniref:enoyl-CoA hydratase-related protein n=1 Tax=Paraburkholderia sp. Ac-20336 TaxID=2703886 RepID=UPI00197CBAD5|nr:enoyl-CoA hydratase-related protein [Paraburkholderia sp. Ac-20336]MBN3801928.1 2,3-dehydroadipyl-CoA hydratase [Paraburkholderia sp. Ac-20336]